MSNSLFYSTDIMKSTDTILGAFAVLGFVLLAYFAFAGPTSNSEIDTDNLVETEEEVLVADDTNEEVVQTDTDDEVVIPTDNTEVTLEDSMTDQMIESNLLADLSPGSIREGVAEFLQSADNVTREEVINALEQNENVMAVNEVDGRIEVIAETPTDTEEEFLTDDSEIVDEEVIASDSETEVVVEEDEADNQPGRVSRFFSNLFGRDDTPDVGGSAEDDVMVGDLNDADGVNLENAYVVKSGDNLWNIMKNDLGYTNAQAAQALQNLTSGDYDDLGLTSGDEDLIFTGQTLDLSVLALS